MKLFEKEPVYMTLKEILEYRETVIEKGIKLGTIISYEDSQYIVLGIARKPIRFSYIVDIIGASDRYDNYTSFDADDILEVWKVEGYMELTKGTLRGIQEVVLESYHSVIDILERSKDVEVGALFHIKGNRYEVILDVERSIEFRVESEEPSLEDIAKSIKNELITLKSKGFHEFQLSQTDEKELIRVLSKEELEELKESLATVIIKLKMLGIL